MLWLPAFLESASPPCLWDVCRVSITPQLSVSACKHREMQVQTRFKTLQNEDKRRQMAPEHLKLCSKKTPPAPKPQGRSERHLKSSTSSSQIQTYKVFFSFFAFSFLFRGHNCPESDNSICGIYHFPAVGQRQHNPTEQLCFDTAAPKHCKEVYQV